MKYFAIIDDDKVGPFTLEQMPKAGVRPSTYVWCKGMSDWVQAREVADICRFYRNHISDLNHPTQNLDVQVSNLSRQEGTDNVPIRFQQFFMQNDISGSAMPDTDLSQPPKTFLFIAIIATILFFFPTGIVSIIFTHKAKSLWKEGKAAESHEAARKAKMMIGFTICIGMIVLAVAMRFI